jgi:phage terminase large subunit
MTSPPTPADQATLDALAWYFDDPIAMVRHEFGVDPDPWQVQALRLYPKSPRLALKACTGPGKTATLAWIGWHFALTRPFSMTGCASITGDNLKTGLWTELNRWRNKSKLITGLFETTGDRIYHRAYPETWRIEARKWARSADKEQIGNALAGLHAEYVMWLLDETGDYPDSVMPTCEAIFSGEPKEAHIIQAGNPTRRSGPLFRAWVKREDADRMWEVISITADPDDPNRTPRVSTKHALEQIKEYGRDNPWVRVKIFGEFPDQDFNALISEDEVRAAFNRHYRAPVGPKILGVDIADYGDDKSVIASRQGLQAFTPRSYRHINSIDGATCVARAWADFPGVGGEADACFLDASGGYGAGWRDQLIQIGRAPIGIHFSASPHDKSQFPNKRTEMAWHSVEWIRRGGALCESEELVQALCQTRYGFRKDQLYLEPKEDIKKRLGFSPDECDAFWLTFAEPVTPKNSIKPVNPWRAQQAWNPFAEKDDIGRGSGRFDPYGE